MTFPSTYAFCELNQQMYQNKRMLPPYKWTETKNTFWEGDTHPIPINSLEQLYTSTNYELETFYNLAGRGETNVDKEQSCRGHDNKYQPLDGGNGARFHRGPKCLIPVKIGRLGSREALLLV